MNNNAEILFAGGVGTVTGAHFILKAAGRVFGVDCGLIQGQGYCAEANYEPFLQDPATVAKLFITHAHLDHIGRIPKFVREGFRGTIYSTGPTKDMTAVMLQDAVSILADEALKCGRDPLYAKEDIDAALGRWETVDYHESIEVGEGITAQFLDAGHILGSGMVLFERNGKKLVCTGDLGNDPSPLLRETESIAGTHVLLMESVYGDRAHEGRETRANVLRDAVEAVRERKGTLLIPSFSIERTQVLLYELNTMIEEEGLQPVPIFLDSPLAAAITDIYRSYPQYFNDETREHFERDTDIFSFPGLRVTVESADSRAIADTKGAKIIIAGSGMSHGGRIRSHEQRYLSDPNASILFVGYQVPGSLGRRIQDGAKKVTINGADVQVRASIGVLSGYSAHKDRDGLVDFVAEAHDTLTQVFVAMGEPKSSLFLTQRLRDFVGVNAIAPAYGETHSIDW